MIVTTKTKQLFELSELSEQAKDNAIKQLWDINIGEGWWEQDGLLDLSDKEIKDRHIKIHPQWATIKGNLPGYYPMYSGLINYNWRLAFDLDRGQYIQFFDIVVRDEDIFRKFLRIPKSIWEKVVYSFVNERRESTAIEFEDISENGLTDREQEIIDRAVEIFSDKVFEAWKMLRDQFEFLQSDESIIETIESNNYLFDAEGNQAERSDYPDEEMTD